MANGYKDLAKEFPYYMSGKSIFDPREELKWRLNNIIRGKFVGKPVNWKGLEAR